MPKTESAALPTIKVADEVWIATALLHRENPSRGDFAVGEIVDRAEKEAISGRLRPGVYVHVVQHCVANRAPSPARYRMLLETREGFRRLFRYPDAFHFGRDGGKVMPEKKAIPERYHSLIDWYSAEYRLSPDELLKKDPILRLRGLGKEIWKGIDPDEYVRQLREGWE